MHIKSFVDNHILFRLRKHFMRCIEVLLRLKPGINHELSVLLEAIIPLLRSNFLPHIFRLAKVSLWGEYHRALVLRLQRHVITVDQTRVFVENAVGRVLVTATLAHLSRVEGP